MSSKESEFIIGSDDENNCISSMSFKTHLYNPLNLPTKYKVIPSPGDLYIVRGGSSIPVNGKPYDANFDGEFTAEILFYGEDEATMYADTKTVRKVPVSIKGWMKEKKYNYDPEGTANYDCDVTIEFTVEDVDYKIAITETYIVYYARDWFD